jgi:hypothetical protein
MIHALFQIPSVPPSTAEEVVQYIGHIVDLGKMGSWLGVSVVAIYIIMYGMKRFGLNAKTWAAPVTALLGLVAGILSKVVGGSSWLESIFLMLSSAAGSQFIHSIWHLFKREK